MIILFLLPLLAGILCGYRNLDAAEILYTPVNELKSVNTLERGFDLIASDEAGKDVYIRLELFAADILRVRVSPLPIKELPSYVVSGDFPDTSSCELSQEDATLRLGSGELRVIVNKSPFRFVIYNSDGNIMVREHGPFGIGIAPPGPGGVGRIRETFAIPSWRDEAFFGLGQKFGRLDKKGSTYSMRNVSGTMSRGGDTPLNVPLLLHTRGYGVYVNSFGDITFKLGAESNEYFTVEVADKVLDYFLIAGPSLKKIIMRYTALTGRPPLPPPWTHGLWYSNTSNDSRANVEAAAQKIRQIRLPCDVINIDGEYWGTAYNDFQFNSEFSEPEAMIANLKKMGFRISLWESPIINRGSTRGGSEYDDSLSIHYGIASGRGYFLKRADGSVYDVSWNHGRGALVDFSNPEAAAWWISLHEPLTRMGVDVFKTNFGYLVPDDALFSNGMTGLEMGSIYSLLYNEAVYKGAARSDSGGVVWSGDGYAGSQRYPFSSAVTQAASFEYIPGAIRSGLSAGMSGISMWGPVIGGSYGVPGAECYVRWFQLGMFSPVAIMNGYSGKAPWEYGKEALDICLRYARLRMRLLPYISSYAAVAHETGLPIMRSLALEFENDLVAHTMDLQYLFGREFLVAPIYSQYNRRTVYIPEGKWVDYWTGEVITGPQVTAVAASLDQLPLFVRGGSIIPMGPEMDYVGQKPTEELTLDIYPEESCRFNLYENGAVFAFSCSTNAKNIFLSLPACDKSYYLQINQASGPWEVRIDNIPIPEIKDPKEFGEAQLGWRFFGEGKKYSGIKIPKEKIVNTAIVTMEKK